jgi:uncharacterized RDD family membrane protein YckC
MTEQNQGSNQRHPSRIPVRCASSSLRLAAVMIDFVPLLLLTVALSTSWLSTTALQETSSSWNAIDRVVDLINHQPTLVLNPLILLASLFMIWSVVSTLRLGGTPGQRLFGLVACTRSGRHLSAGRAIAHAILAVLTTLVAGIGPLWSLADPERRTLYDRLAGVLLIHEPEA